MGIEKITEKIKSSCDENNSMEKMLLELFQFQLEDRGWWKDCYKDIIRKYSKEDKDDDAN